MKREKRVHEISVKCGKTTDSLEMLQSICEKKAKDLQKTLNIPADESLAVVFWTEDTPELIGVGYFSKTQDGTVKYELDYSESTL